MLALQRKHARTPNLIADLRTSGERKRCRKALHWYTSLPGRAGWELRLVVQGGLRILDKVEAMNYATLNQRPTLRVWDYCVMVWRALRM
jgi:phytoene/squalene synthetase